MRIAGVDDAGRGPVIGPLIVAGVKIPEQRADELTDLGVRDSKTLTRANREGLVERILETVEDYAYAELRPEQLDEVVHRRRRLERLNLLEAKAMAALIERLRPDRVYVDASDVDEDRFSKHIQESLDYPVSIVSEHHADSKYPIVSAASILAKVRRDDAVDQLKYAYGDFGSGYATDPRTIGFLEEWLREKGALPPIVRMSWKTLPRLKSRIFQTKL